MYIQWPSFWAFLPADNERRSIFGLLAVDSAGIVRGLASVESGHWQERENIRKGKKRGVRVSTREEKAREVEE